MQSINFGCIFFIKNNIMEIFGKHIFGEDAEQFCKLSKEDKKEWILKYTNVRSEVVIEEFLNSPINKKDCGCGCGGNKQKDGNIASGISKEVEASAEPVNNGNASKRNSTKRPKKT
jgi:hypothetical protein